jgi:organic radical activating enzyme
MQKEPTAKVIFSSTFLDYPDNSSNAVIVYFQGCDNNCDGCHNLRFKSNKKLIDGAIEVNALDFACLVSKNSKRHKTNKIVLSGGDPISKHNIEFIKSFMLLNHLYGLYDICIYTGHNIDYVKNNWLIYGWKYIKCGGYDKNLNQKSEKTSKKFVLASSNQQIYNNKFELLTVSGILLFDQERVM